MSLFRKKTKAPIIQGGTVLPKKKRFWIPFVVIAGILLLAAAGFVIYRVIQARQPAVHYDLRATVCAVGDISLSQAQLDGCTDGAGSDDLYALFAGVAQTISSADLAVGNLEGNLTAAAPDPGNYLYPSRFAAALDKAGFDLIQTANSRTIQNGVSAIAETNSLLRANGMVPVGSYADPSERAENGVIVREVNGIRFAFIAFTKGLNNMRLPDGYAYCVDLLYTDYDSSYQKIDTEAITAKLDAAKKERPDFIIALLHWGSEYESEISKMQEKLTAMLIDGGVDVIIGSHSHYVGQMEKRTISVRGGEDRKVFIAYDLGDLLTVSERLRAQYGCMLNLTFEKDSETGRKRIGEVSYTPTYCQIPSEALETTDYAVLDILDALKLRENRFYDSISDAMAEKLTGILDDLKSQTNSTFQIKK